MKNNILKEKKHEKNKRKNIKKLFKGGNEDKDIKINEINKPLPHDPTNDLNQSTSSILSPAPKAQAAPEAPANANASPTVSEPANATTTTKSLKEHIKDIKSSLDKIKSLTKEAPETKEAPAAPETKEAPAAPEAPKASVAPETKEAEASVVPKAPETTPQQPSVAQNGGAEEAQGAPVPEAQQQAAPVVPVQKEDVNAEIDKILEIINEIKKLDDYEIGYIKEFIDNIETGLKDIKQVIDKPEFGEKLASIDKNVSKLEKALNIDTSLKYHVDNSVDENIQDGNKQDGNKQDDNYISSSDDENTRDISDEEKESGIDKLIDNIEGMNVKIENKKNDTDLLTKVTMIIYDIIMMLIVFFCIIIFILNVVNIIKFLYKCFIEVGSTHHNDLDTGETFRYRLLHYVLFINYCNIPSIFSSFNSANTSSSTFLKLTEVIKNAFNKKDEINEALGLKETFGELFKLLESKKEKSIEGENKEESSVQIIENDNNKKFKEPEFNLFLVIRLLFLCLKLFISLITIMLIVLVTFILLQVTVAMGNMSTIKINLIMKQGLFSLLLKLLAISLVFILVSLVVYKTMFVKIYENYLKTYVNILAIDIELNIIKKLDGETSLKVERIGDYFRYNINNNTVIEGEIINIINNDEISEQTKEKVIIIYMLLNHVNKGYKNKKDYDKIFNYFMTGPGQKGSNNYTLNFDMGMENEIVTFYSLIPNKHRRVPIAYYKYESIEGIKNIELAEKIRQKVNNKITNINRYISEANNTFDDDNFIVNLGWYFLVNLIISTIYMIIIITYIYTIIYAPDFNFMNFVTMVGSSTGSEGDEE